jgi:hypothetical protein
VQPRSWLTVGLLAGIAALLALLLVLQFSPSAQAQASEGQRNGVIAVAVPLGRESLLYLVDTTREVVLVYGFHYPGSGATTRDVRNGAFEFLAGRLYHWDALLASRQEYTLRDARTLRGLRPSGGAGSSERAYKELERRAP